MKRIRHTVVYRARENGPIAGLTTTETDVEAAPAALRELGSPRALQPPRVSTYVRLWRALTADIPPTAAGTRTIVIDLTSLDLPMSPEAAEQALADAIAYGLSDTSF